MSSTRGTRTLTNILPDLCKVCRKIPGWYSNMPGGIPGLTSHMGHPEMPELIPAALVVETAARGHLNCLRAAISASEGEYECIDGYERLEPGNRPLLQYGTLLLYGPSALMAAAWNGHPRCVKLLIKEKFIMCVDPNESETVTAPICLAAKSGNTECFDLLFKAHKKQNSMNAAFENAIYKGSEECVRMLIAAGADVNQVDEYDRTPLMCKNPLDKAAITKALIEAGADPNIESDKEGNALEETALTAHIDEESFKSVCVLLEAGADVNASNDGDTPLMHAVDGFVKNKWPFVVALLLKGAKINISENSGVNPLTRSLMQREPEGDRKIQNILFAAGEKIDIHAVERKGKKVPKHLQPQFNLMDVCRRKIREHLLDLDPHTHLFTRVPRLALPSIMADYLLYDQKLDDTEYMKILSMADDGGISFVDFHSDDYGSSDDQDADDDDNDGNNDDDYDSSDGQDFAGSDEDIDDNDDDDNDDNNDDVCNSSDGQDVNGSDDNVDDNNDNDDDDFIHSDDADFGSSDGQDVDDHDDDNTDVVTQDIVSNEEKTGDKSL